MAIAKDLLLFSISTSGDSEHKVSTIFLFVESFNHFIGITPAIKNAVSKSIFIVE